MALLMIGILVGLDNLAVATGLGLLDLGRRPRLWYALSCFAFEAMATVFGLWIGRELYEAFGPVVGWLAPACLALCGLLILRASVRDHETPSFLNQGYAVLLLPFFLSLDNLSAGIGLGVSGVPILVNGLLIGAISGTMAAVGFRLGGQVRARSIALTDRFAGLWLIVCAVIFRFVDLS